MSQHFKIIRRDSASMHEAYESSRRAVVKNLCEIMGLNTDEDIADLESRFHEIKEMDFSNASAEGMMRKIRDRLMGSRRKEFVHEPVKTASILDLL